MVFIKYFVSAILLFALFGCASKKVMLAGSSYASPIELTQDFYEITFAGDEKPLSDTIKTKDNVRTFGSTWCMNDALTKEEYLSKINENCNFNGGTLIQDKWCVAKTENTLKYLIDIYNPPRDSSLLGKCKTSVGITVYVRETFPAVSTQKPLVLNCPPPNYPGASERAKEEGLAIVDLHISSEGKGIARIKQSSGFLRLDDSAVRALSSCRVVPKIDNGIPVDQVVELKAEFRLKKDNKQ